MKPSHLHIFVDTEMDSPGMTDNKPSQPPKDTTQHPMRKAHTPNLSMSLYSYPYPYPVPLIPSPNTSSSSSLFSSMSKAPTPTAHIQSSHPYTHTRSLSGYPLMPLQTMRGSSSASFKNMLQQQQYQEQQQQQQQHETPPLTKHKQKHPSNHFSFTPSSSNLTPLSFSASSSSASSSSSFSSSSSSSKASMPTPPPPLLQSIEVQTRAQNQNEDHKQDQDLSFPSKKAVEHKKTKRKKHKNKNKNKSSLFLMFMPDHFCSSIQHYRQKVGGEIAWYFSFTYSNLLFYSILFLFALIISIQSARATTPDQADQTEDQRERHSFEFWRLTAGHLQGDDSFQTWMICGLVVMCMSVCFPFLYLAWVQWMIRTGKAEVHLEGGYGVKTSSHGAIQCFAVDIIERKFEVTPRMRRLGYVKSAACFLLLFALDILVNFAILFLFIDFVGSTLAFSLVTIMVFVFNFLWMIVCNLSTKLEYHTSIGKQNSAIFFKTFLFENGTTILIFWARRNLITNPTNTSTTDRGSSSCLMDEFVIDLLQMLIMQFLIAPCLEILFLKIQRPLFRKLAEDITWITEGMKDPSFECPPLYSKMFYRLFLSMTAFVLFPLSIVIPLTGLLLIHLLDRYKITSGLRVVRDQLNNHYGWMLALGWLLVLAESWFLPPNGMWRNLSGEFNSCFRPCEAFFLDNQLPSAAIEGYCDLSFNQTVSSWTNGSVVVFYSSLTKKTILPILF